MLVSEYKEILENKDVSIGDIRKVLKDAVLEIEKRDNQIDEFKRSQRKSNMQLESELQKMLILSIIENTPMQGPFKQVREVTEQIVKLVEAIENAEVIERDNI